MRMSSIVVFSLKDERYGVPIEKVREILPLMKVTSVPGTPHYFKGFLNVRGELISLIDLRKFAGMEELDDLSMARILILSSDDGVTQGIMVDEVSNIVELPWQDLQPIDEGKGSCGIPKEFLKGILIDGSEIIVVLDVDSLLSGEKKEPREEVVGR